eukprot:CAMPEP_0119121734 /NCGR_PEP_ID=MMETSP1310-20130426/2225_1 /TAXON_ID=464262 /ORGANISM="Genus nov. species nov., Strain RCC2339" /LENGTH=377 /DNA_ID=CAMNT_0007111311 /DNA_START=163 /DNA_END=1296 /DNA_ORIENTATION=+
MAHVSRMEAVLRHLGVGEVGVDGMAGAATAAEGGAAVFRRSRDSVVFVQTSVLQAPTSAQGPFGLLMPRSDAIVKREGAGSGVVWDAAGHIVTNAHVVRQASSVEVGFRGVGKTVSAKLVGADAVTDLAVLKVDPKGMGHALAPISRGQSQRLEVGDEVFALGNPFGLDLTMTAGIVSGLGREIPAQEGSVLSNLIQTDASINPGNSGGPLLDARTGGMVGVTTAILSPSGASVGLGFAIPVDLVEKVVGEIIQHGRVQRAQLGIFMAPDRVRERLGVEKGVVVWGVRPNSPAAVAGVVGATVNRDESLVIGDVIVAVGETSIETTEALLKAVGKFRLGDRTPLLVIRGPTRRRVTLQIHFTELENHPPNASFRFKE